MPSLLLPSSSLTPPALREPYTLEGHIRILLAPRDGAHSRERRRAGSGPATLVLRHLWLCEVLMAMALPFICLQKS